MTEQELDEVLTLRWPAVVRRVMADGTNDFELSFVRSIARQGRRSCWRPSQKQLAIMDRMLVEHGYDRESDLEVIEH